MPDALGDPVDSAVAFLTALFAPGDLVLVRPIETWTDGQRKRARVDYDGIRYLRIGLRASDGTWQPYDRMLDAAVRQVLERAQVQQTNVFFGVCPRHGADGRFDLAWQIRTVRALWADVDDCRAPEAIARVERASMPAPSLAIASGNGAHLYWLLDEPHRIDDAGDPRPVLTEFSEADSTTGKRQRRQYLLGPGGQKLSLDARQNVPELSPRARLVQDTIAGIAAAIGGDHTHDISRILRIPGTWNRKDQRNGRNPTPCELVELRPDRRYRLAEFARWHQTSPQRLSRAKIAQIPLPPHRRPNLKVQDQLSQLAAASAAADVGQRSEADFSLCCYAIERGVEQATVWEMVRGVGKFAESGQAYFDRTWSAAQQHTRERIFSRSVRRAEAKRKPEADKQGDQPAEPPAPISNVRQAERADGDEEPKEEPLEISTILTAILERTGDWPRRVGNTLFVHDSYGVCWLEKPEDLFGWLQRVAGIVHWRSGAGCVTKAEVFSELRRTVTAYEAVEYLPHYPPIPGHYYACKIPAPGDGKCLSRLLERFSPETELDRLLILTMFATAFWGGKGGQRPAFVICSDSGRGAGKSKLTDMVGYLAGGMIEVAQHEDAAVMRQRFLSPEALTKRVVRIDNVKSLKFSWADLESLITSPTIGGKRMYVGEGTRPNTLTWLVTLNGVSLSTDIAQRSVIIKVVRPKRAGSWESETLGYIDEHREELIADLLGFLQIEDATPISEHSRWAAWETAVLARLEQAVELQALVAQRAQGADTELEEAEEVEAYFGSRLEYYGYESSLSVVHIPTGVAAKWYREVTNDRVKSTIACSKILGQFCSESRFQNLVINPSRKHGRGFVWNAKLGLRSVDYDIEDRIERREKQKKEIPETSF